MKNWPALLCLGMICNALAEGYTTESKAETVDLCSRPSALDEFAQNLLREAIVYQLEKHGYAGDNPLSSKKLLVPWNPSQWAEWYNDTLHRIRSLPVSDATKSFQRATFFLITVGQQNITKPDVALSAGDIWRLLMPGDNLYWNSGNSWHTDFLFEVDNGARRPPRFIKRGSLECYILDSWPNRIGEWLGWSSTNGDFKLVGSKLEGKEFTGVIVPQSIFSMDAKAVLVLRTLDFADQLVDWVKTKNGATLAGSVAFGLGEQLWTLKDTAHLAESVSLFTRAETEWKAASEDKLVFKAKCRRAATLEMVGYCARRSSLEQGADSAENVFDGVVGSNAVNEARALQAAIGEKAFADSLPAEMCIMLAEAAGPIDKKVARDYLSKALASSKGLSGLRKSHALTLRAYVSGLLADNESSIKDANEAKKILSVEETTLRTDITNAFGDSDHFNEIARPDLAKRREACDFQNGLLSHL